MRDLGTWAEITAFPYDIIDAQQLVGYSETAEGSRYAFIPGVNGEGMTGLS
jgi:hypothetical protein